MLVLLQLLGLAVINCYLHIMPYRLMQHLCAKQCADTKQKPSSHEVKDLAFLSRKKAMD